MLTGAAGPRLSHLLKSIDKSPRTEGFMREMDTALVSTWLECLTSSNDLEHSLGPSEWDSLTDWLDLPPSYGGSGLHSLSRSADEELLGSFAGIAASLIAFCRKTELPVYISIAQALEALDDATVLLEEETPPSPEHPCATLEAIKAAAVRCTTSLSPPRTASSR